MTGLRRPKSRARLYFSFRSPYSWMTVLRLRAAVPDAMRRIDWVPYFDPDQTTERMLTERGAEFHYVQMSRAKHRYILMDTRRQAERHGLRMAWPVDVDPWWELPHLAWLAAREQGRALEFYDAVTAARWQRGEDICTPRVLRQVALDAGVDPEAALAAPHDPEVREAAVAGLVQAYHDDVFGVPYLRWGQHRFWGLDRLADFLAVWSPPEPPLAEPRPAAPGQVLAGYDTDTAGGCG
ncbi:2-hydroxychromene-2-carboxylate isomerase [Micromonospora sp. CPCC 206061]|uniref:2-hydroxychromene-2-carboxylate isomerase n=1 Tax=Micromonospora sp. CPCC 206061 TaxID=3122410 RepID=UPI002FF00CDB